jgi:F1F0 ATPase subunit 2
MNDILQIIGVFIAGFAIGTFFFGGLWFTIKKAVSSKIPALWFFGSFIVRVSITLLGFYYVAAGNLQSLLICTLGFVIARIVVSQVTKPTSEKTVEPFKVKEYETES